MSICHWRSRDSLDLLLLWGEKNEGYYGCCCWELSCIFHQKIHFVQCYPNRPARGKAAAGFGAARAGRAGKAEAVEGVRPGTGRAERAGGESPGTGRAAVGRARGAPPNPDKAETGRAPVSPLVAPLSTKWEIKPGSPSASRQKVKISPKSQIKANQLDTYLQSAQQWLKDH